jgi:threonylcarbamoyladenosine tRNA methylthiotransferase MtaB
MNRHYTSKNYRDLIETACRLIPDLGLGTDLMVGFPSETEGEFDQTVHFARELPFSYFHVFSYSPRPGTAAAKLKASVPIAIIHRRSRSLAELSRMKSIAYHERHIGRTLSVLFEKGLRDGFRTGLTDTFMRVAVSGGVELAGTLQKVTITGVTDGLAVGRLVASEVSARSEATLV